ncbi:MAG: DNA polymerase IV [Phycisphaeraceae bacterium]|nr:DNA polymerase IV [Phycisphaeraceae bacterium]
MPWPDDQRAILHVDMDQFFAAIAVLDDPSLKGKPVLVGAGGPRGVLSTASYEARKFGCRSAMPTAVALRLCPDAVLVKVPGERIREMSAKLFDILDRVSPLVQPLSCDEAFIDATGSQRLLGPPEQIARHIKEQARQELGLTASVGVAPNKFLAKLASDLEKPDGLTVIPPDPHEMQAILDPLPIGKMWGVGPATEAKLAKRGVRTFAHLRQLTEQQLTKDAGEDGSRLHRLSRGIDDRPVVPSREAKSVGHEQTFREDLKDPDHVRAIMLTQAEDVARRLRHKQLLARGVTVKIRFGDFQTITRSTTLDRATDLTDELYRPAIDLFDRWARSAFQPVRLIGVSAGPLTHEPPQQDLFADPQREKKKQVEQTLDQIKSKFGKRAVHRGQTPNDERTYDPRNGYG